MEGARMQTLLIAAALVLSCASRPVVAFSAQPLGLSTNVAARVLRCVPASPRQMQASVPALRMKKEDGEATQVRSPDLCVPAAARATLHTPRADDLLADSHSHRRAPLACPGACPS
jgi:hypothetical protein